MTVNLPDGGDAIVGEGAGTGASSEMVLWTGLWETGGGVKGDGRLVKGDGDEGRE